MSFLDKINPFKKKPVQVLTRIDEEKIKNDEVIKAQAQKISSQEAQLSKIFAIEKSKKDKVDEKKKENEFNKKLLEQKKELDAHRRGKIIKLGKFYKHYFEDKKFREKLEICDKNDEVVLGKFGDFGIMEGGKLCILDINGELMSFGKSLSHILFKPDAFENMARRGRFLIPVDKDGNWIEDIEYKEIPEPMDAVFDEETGKVIRINWSRVKTSEVKKVIAEKMEQINSLQDSLQDKETLVIKLRQKIDDLNRTLYVSRAEADISQSELSSNINKFIDTEKRFADMHIQITKLTELKAIHQNLLDRKDDIIDQLIKKLELTGEPKADRVRTEVYADLERMKAILPEKVEVKQEVVQERKETTNPMEVIKK